MSTPRTSPSSFCRAATAGRPRRSSPSSARLLGRLDASDIPIAAICAATVAIARIGLLKGRRHTSNGLEYLRALVPGYADAEHYVDAPAVRDRRLITASGLADIEFTRELFEELGVLSPEDRALWASMFRSATLPRESA